MSGKKNRKEINKKIEELLKTIMDLTLENIDSDDILKTIVGHIHTTQRMFSSLMDGVKELQKRKAADPDKPIFKIPSEEARTAITKALNGSKGHANLARTDLQNYIFFLVDIINQIKTQELDTTPDLDDEGDDEDDETETETGDGDETEGTA